MRQKRCRSLSAGAPKPGPGAQHWEATTKLKPNLLRQKPLIFYYYTEVCFQLDRQSNASADRALADRRLRTGADSQQNISIEDIWEDIGTELNGLCHFIFRCQMSTAMNRTILLPFNWVENNILLSVCRLCFSLPVSLAVSHSMSSVRQPSRVAEPLLLKNPYISCSV